MRDVALLGARLLLGGYMGIHASQKLLGKFHGPGLEGAGAMFEKNGLAPGKQMAKAAAATEITGGLLTVTGFASPAGPLAIAGVMTVAAAHNRQGGLMAVRGGIELPVAYATLALTLAATGPGKYKIGPPVISVAAAALAICLPGARPFFSNIAPAPSRPGPWNLPSSFCEAWMPMYPPSSSLAPSRATSRMMSSEVVGRTLICVLLYPAGRPRPVGACCLAYVHVVFTRGG